MWKNISPEMFGNILTNAVHPFQWMGQIVCCGMAVKRM
jgi:hypothetical protein